MFITCGGCYSSRNSVEGDCLRNICDAVGLRQIVREPTRGENLLDLALTDLDAVRCKVVGKIADHKGLHITLPLTVPKIEVQSRLDWHFKGADWHGLNQALWCQDWSWLQAVDADTGAARLTASILSLAELFIPSRWLKQGSQRIPGSATRSCS